MNEPTGSLDGEERRLADLIDQIADALRRGEDVCLERLLQSQPDLAEPLRAALPVVRRLVAAGNDAAHTRTQALSFLQAPGVSPALDGTLGDYRIVREIGRGGMGVVYEAEQISLRRRVALKILPFAAVLDSKHLRRFKNEALAAASLDHPHIVSVHAVGCERGVHYFAMQFIEGQTLDRLIGQLRASRRTALPISQTPATPPSDSSPNVARLSESNANRCSTLRVETHFKSL